MKFARLTKAEKRAYDATIELATAMRGVMPGIGQNEQADADWAEVARAIHDVQSRLMTIVASRAGFPCRAPGATNKEGYARNQGPRPTPTRSVARRR